MQTRIARLPVLGKVVSRALGARLIRGKYSQEKLELSAQHVGFWVLRERLIFGSPRRIRNVPESCIGPSACPIRGWNARGVS